MKQQELRGVSRGETDSQTVPAASAPRPQDRVNRQFKVDRPNQLWVSDPTYVSTWQGWLYVAFAINVFARRIVGWRVSSSGERRFARCAALPPYRAVQAVGLAARATR